jgi:2-succinyl-5-enolpyruvyl-6-hydroxy-3-cyclohexene-1-carboxylate synthase
MISTKKNGIQLLVSQCVSHGMRNVVISPGSRNAPFTIAFDEHPEVNCFVIHDERSAAFFALGMSQQLGAPVGIVCTSGSAPLNYYPAIAEAYYQCLPLVVITADRPEYWIDQGDGQTIRQNNVFEKHVKYSCSFHDELKDSDAKWYLERETAIAFNEGNGKWKGPIHFNVGISEPLYETTELLSFQKRAIQMVSGTFEFAPNDVSFFSNQLESKKILVLCGQLNKDEGLNNELELFAENASVLVITENTSNLTGSRFIHCIDRFLNALDENDSIEFRPDLLITIGNAIVSKRIKSYLRKYKPNYHWKIGQEFPYMDTFQCLSHSFQTDPKSFFRAVNRLVYKRSQSNYSGRWNAVDFKIKDKIDVVLKNMVYSDITVFNEIVQYLPDAIELHMANSSVVRYMQLFDPASTIKYWCNRGTSGIDGSSSTAVGASVAGKNKLHVLISGDISFFYDSNAFLNQYTNGNLRIILINNSGGGIFRIIPGPKATKQLENYFEATHDMNAKGICETANIQYEKVSNLTDLTLSLEKFFEFDDERPKLLEIFTPKEVNAVMLNDFFEHLKAAAVKQ